MRASGLAGFRNVLSRVRSIPPPPVRHHSDGGDAEEQTGKSLHRGARLLWLGKERGDRLLRALHGGGLYKLNPVVTRSLEPLAFHPCLRLKSAFDGFAVAMRRLHIPAAGCTPPGTCTCGTPPRTASPPQTGTSPRTVNYSEAARRRGGKFGGKVL